MSPAKSFQNTPISQIDIINKPSIWTQILDATNLNLKWTTIQSNFTLFQPRENVLLKKLCHSKKKDTKGVIVAGNQRRTDKRKEKKNKQRSIKITQKTKGRATGTPQQPSWTHVLGKGGSSLISITNLLSRTQWRKPMFWMFKHSV